MEPSLGILGGGAGGGGGGSGTGLSCEQTAKVVKDYMGVPPKETELELGLSLSGGSSGGVVMEKEKSSAWGEYGRILTAKGFPEGFSSGRPASAAGTKRERAAADCVDEKSASSAISQVVGWPPIRAYRMNALFNQTKTSNIGEDSGVGGHENTEKSDKTTPPSKKSCERPRLMD